jgi:hypothetical protein
MRSIRWLAVSTIVALGLAGASASLATTVHGNFSGTNVDFLGVQETTTSPGDPEPLFGAPTVIGNQLLFFPTGFASTSAGGSSDVTSSQMQMFIDAKPLSTIDQISITEFGEKDLAGVGTAATSASVSAVVDITVLEVNNVLLTTPIFIAGNVMTFTPDDDYALPGDLGFSIWTGNLLIDIESVVDNVTRLQLTFKNILDTTSEAGTTAFIQKDVVSGPVVVIEVIPEPGTAILLGLGVAGLALRRR